MIEKFNEEFLEYLSSCGVASDKIDLLRRMRGITIADFQTDIGKDRVTQNVTIEYDEFV